jgi:prepilin-type processing-associated H-X9-DG protein
MEPRDGYGLPPPWPLPGWVKDHHNEGANFTFLDGHSKWLTLTTAHQNNFYYFLRK